MMGNPKKQVGKSPESGDVKIMFKMEINNGLKKRKIKMNQNLNRHIYMRLVQKKYNHC